MQRSARVETERLAGFLLAVAAAGIAVVGARGYAGGWNDGSRLAMVQSLVDRHTLRIDESIFVRVPPPSGATPLPYPDDALLLQHGTQDKLLIDGHYYSDKSPVPGILLAGWYQVLQFAFGLTASGRPDLFCYWMTLASSGLAYVAAVWCLFQVGAWLHLPLSLRLPLVVSFAASTVALPYTRQVNNHIMLLGVAAALLLGLVGLTEAGSTDELPVRRLLGVGTLAGVGYTIDLVAGPLLLVCTLAVVGSRCRCSRGLAVFLLSALPWIALHHALNYAVGGTLKPANAVAAYLNWPGSPFDPQHMTGRWHHTVGHFLAYAPALLLGKRGFLGYNLPLLLALPAFVVLLMRRSSPLPEIVWAGAWSASTWLVYALTSNNYSGACLSIRWFVPLLVPGYLVLAVFLRDCPRYRPDFLVLSGSGLVLAYLMWRAGPWTPHIVPFFWPLQVAALASWAGCCGWRRTRK